MEDSTARLEMGENDGDARLRNAASSGKEGFGDEGLILYITTESYNSSERMSTAGFVASGGNNGSQESKSCSKFHVFP